MGGHVLADRMVSSLRSLLRTGSDILTPLATSLVSSSSSWASRCEFPNSRSFLTRARDIDAVSHRRLRIDRSKLKWKAKLAGAFDNKVDTSALTSKDKREARNSKWTLFLLPFITVLREGLEAVVFVGGVSVPLAPWAVPPRRGAHVDMRDGQVSLGQSAKSIPLAAICGILVGFVIGCMLRSSVSLAM